MLIVIRWLPSLILKLFFETLQDYINNTEIFFFIYSIIIPAQKLEFFILWNYTPKSSPLLVNYTIYYTLLFSNQNLLGHD